MKNESAVPPSDLQCDVLVIGSGAAGLSAAISARLCGANVIATEKASRFGGTTARSGGWAWIPLSPQAAAAGIIDSEEDVMTYLRHEIGNELREDMVQAFLRNGSSMLELYEAKTSLRFEIGTAFPDYHPEKPGARTGGRALSTVPMAAADLGPDLRYLAPPLRELSLAGMVIGSGTELRHFFQVTRSLRSAIFVAKRLVTYARDVLLHGRSMRLVNGNALAGRLAKTTRDLGIPLWLDSAAVELIREGNRVVGAMIARPEGQMRVLTRCAVILACGGFPHDVARRTALYSHDAGEGEHFPMAPPSNTGDGLKLAERAGAAIGKGLPDNAAWAPVSRLVWPDGARGAYPHFVDRGKPGIIAVTANGRRFVNESNSYHDFIRGLIAQKGNTGLPPAFFIADSRALGRYGLGVAKPFPFPKRHWITTGYLIEARSLEELARKAGIDAKVLSETVARFNAGAAKGSDPEFGRGSTAYNRFQGDPTHRPNACLAPITKPPFYAVRIQPGDIGTFEGIITDDHARVLDKNGTLIEGLYAVGNDMQSIMGGHYPGGGITLGPALVFGYIAGRDAVARPQHSVPSHQREGKDT